MNEAGEAGGRRAFPGRQLKQHAARFTGGAKTRSSAEDEFPILPQDVEVLIYRR
jgi:hypothetical protein